MSNMNNMRPPPRPRSPSGNRSQSSTSQASMRSDSSMSNTSSMEVPPLTQRSPYLQQLAPTRPSTAGGPGPSSSTQTLQGYPRQVSRTSVDVIRTNSPMSSQYPGQHPSQRTRQYSQGFFEPTLPNAAPSNNVRNASQIAAQAAMHHSSPPISMGGQERKRSYPGLAPINVAGPPGGSRRPSETMSPPLPLTAGLTYSNGSVGGNRLAATTAANVAFPNGRSPLPSPGLPPPRSNFTATPPPLPDKEVKAKISKMKLFKPKNIVLSKEKDGKALPSIPSPSKTPSTANFLRSGFPNASSTSLIDPMSNAGSLYSSANASTSTLVPAISEKDKEKRHHFLSRQKNKLRDEPTQLPLSSAHSNSQATNPDKPQPLYNFTPDSPGPSTFAKTMSGFDLRHGGRALREKKKEEKAAAAAARLELTPIMSNTSTSGMTDQLLGPSSYETSLGGPPSGASLFSFPAETPVPVTAQTYSNIGAQMGLPGLGPDDAWPLLKARLLNLFSGETLITPIEDFNALVSVHVRRCVQRRSPVVLVEDVRELLQTGFGSLAQTLRGVPDDRLVTNLVEMWIGLYGAILPFLQAVFLPLELEFKGRGTLMTAREAQEFWGAIPEGLKMDERPSSAGEASRSGHMSEELEIRRITLIAFRDTVILPKHESMLNIFSRLSLDSINASVAPEPNSKGREHARSDPAAPGAERPGTAGSLSPRLSSFNSQGSTLLDAASNSSGGGHDANRSRTTSNTSAGSFGTNLPHVHSPSLGGGPGAFSATSQPQAPAPLPLADPAKVTETVARMLQCLYVLAACRTGDGPQASVDRLTSALKYNYLARGRTGRDRRGWVGMKGRVGLVGA